MGNDVGARAAQPVSDHNRAVAPMWSPDGNALYYTVSSRESCDARSCREGGRRASNKTLPRRITFVTCRRWARSPPKDGMPVRAGGYRFEWRSNDRPWTALVGDGAHNVQPSLAGWEVARLYLRSKRRGGSVHRRVSGWSHASNLALGRPRTALARRRARTVLFWGRSIVLCRRSLERVYRCRSCGAVSRCAQTRKRGTGVRRHARRSAVYRHRRGRPGEPGQHRPCFELAQLDSPLKSLRRRPSAKSPGGSGGCSRISRLP